MEAVCAGVVGGLIYYFPKATAEILVQILPKAVADNIVENKVSACCCWKPEKEQAPEPEPEPETRGDALLSIKTRKKIQTTENYINTLEWRESEIPERSMRLIHENIDNEEEYEKIANTCVKLLELFAMKSSRREELSRIRDRLMQVDSELAERIDLDRFSQCAFYEGRILLYR
jgi:hypothetical protein